MVSSILNPATEKQQINNLNKLQEARNSATADIENGISLSAEKKNKLVDAMSNVVKCAQEIYKSSPFDNGQMNSFLQEIELLRRHAVVHGANQKAFDNLIQKIQETCSVKAIDETMRKFQRNQEIMSYNREVIEGLQRRLSELQKKQSGGRTLTGMLTKRDDRISALDGLIDKCKELQRKTPPEPIDLASVVVDLKENGHTAGLYKDRKYDPVIFKIGLQDQSSGISGKLGAKSEFRKVLDKFQKKFEEISASVRTPSVKNK